MTSSAQGGADGPSGSAVLLVGRDLGPQEGDLARSAEGGPGLLPPGEPGTGHGFVEGAGGVLGAQGGSGQGIEG